MKKVKEFSRSYIFLSILYIAIGIVLLVWPNLKIETIGNGLGIIMIVVGATYAVIYFTGNRKQEGYLQVDLVIGIVCAAFGVFILLTPEFLAMILPFAMATVLLVGAIVKIQSAVSMKRLFIRRWYLALIGALIIIALGIVLLVFPFKKDSYMLLYIGVCLILDGLTNLMGLFCIKLRTKKLEKIQRKNPGVDIKALIEDEWEKADAVKAERKARKKERKQTEVVVDEAEDVTDNEKTPSAAQEGSQPEKTAADTAVDRPEDKPGKRKLFPKKSTAAEKTTIQPDTIIDGETVDSPSVCESKEENVSFPVPVGEQADSCESDKESEDIEQS
ncbi:MAG: DUF308 domain-containing protein [Lachnospiraceae bacterium]|nr:DUF308 domain-containing protein [Lachnospiraceae bacterium]